MSHTQILKCKLYSSPIQLNEGATLKRLATFVPQPPKEKNETPSAFSKFSKHTPQQ